MRGNGIPHTGRCRPWPPHNTGTGSSCRIGCGSVVGRPRIAGNTRCRGSRREPRRMSTRVVSPIRCGMMPVLPPSPRSLRRMPYFLMLGSCRIHNTNAFLAALVSCLTTHNNVTNLTLSLSGSWMSQRLSKNPPDHDSEKLTCMCQV